MFVDIIRASIHDRDRDAEIFKKALGVKCFEAYVAIAEVEKARRKTRGEKRLATVDQI